MAANFRFVAHATERDTGEFPSHRPGDGTSQGGFANPWRADKTQDGAFRVVFQFAHSEVFKNAVFDFLEIIVIFVEYLAGMVDVEIIFGRDRPRQVHQPFEIGADHRMFGRFWRNHAQPF